MEEKPLNSMRENLFHAQRRVALMTMTSLRMAACTSLLGHHKIHNSRATSCLSFCKEKAVFQENSIRNIYRTARGFFLGTGQGSTESQDSRALRGVSAHGAGRRLGSGLWLGCLMKFLPRERSLVVWDHCAAGSAREDWWTRTGTEANRRAGR